MLNIIYALDKKNISETYILEAGINLSELFASYCIMLCSNLVISDMKFNVDEFGKPYLENDDKLHYNISHSKDLIVCVVSERRIGVDIEQIRPVKTNSFVSTFFSENEWSYIQDSKNKYNSFFELWTLKESYVKYLGFGLRKGFSQFEIISSRGKYFVVDNGVLYGNLNIISFRINTEYIVSICSETIIQNQNINFVEFSLINNASYI